MLKAESMPNGDTKHPSNDFNVLGDVASVGEPMAFQQLLDIIHVDAPSSMTVRKMVFSHAIIEI